MGFGLENWSSKLDGLLSVSRSRFLVYGLRDAEKLISSGAISLTNIFGLCRNPPIFGGGGGVGRKVDLLGIFGVDVATLGIPAILNGAGGGRSGGGLREASLFEGLCCSQSDVGESVGGGGDGARGMGDLGSGEISTVDDGTIISSSSSLDSDSLSSSSPVTYIYKLGNESENIL